eukprot:scaffold39103_cov42-Cyclotella_meneghiniana.AAC.1
MAVYRQITAADTMAFANLYLKVLAGFSTPTDWFAMQTYTSDDDCSPAAPVCKPEPYANDDKTYTSDDDCSPAAPVCKPEPYANDDNAWGQPFVTSTVEEQHEVPNCKRL